MRNHRILFIDAARTYAIILALAAHALHVFGVPEFGPWIMNYPFFTSMATPMFIFMFGVMMEIVYAKRAEQNGLSVTDGRLFHRAYQCYLAGALTSVAALLGGVADLDAFFSSLIWVDRTRYDSILMMYAGALLLMPFIVRLRLRYGAKGLLTLLLITIITVHIISFTNHLDLGPWGVLVNRIVGIGSDPGLSIFAAFIFIIMGMTAGNFVREGNSLYVFAGVVGGLCLIASLLIWNATSEGTIKGLVAEYAYRNFRQTGNILFFLMGSFYCLVTLCVIKFIVERFPQTHKLIHFLSPLGVNSLLAFAFGNSVLNLSQTLAKDVVPSSLAIAMFFVLVWCVCRYTNRLPTYQFWYALLNPQIQGRYPANKRNETS